MTEPTCTVHMGDCVTGMTDPLQEARQRLDARLDAHDEAYDQDRASFREQRPEPPTPRRDAVAHMTTKRRSGIPADQGQLTEKQFQAQVVQMAAFFGWRHYHNLYAIGSDRGYPDLTLVHPRHGVLWLELKGPRGRPGPAQEEWIDTLRAAGQRAHIVYPTDFDMVAALLSGDCR